MIQDIILLCIFEDSLIFNNSIIMKTASIIGAFLGGAVVGAALGLLFAPEKGDETRHRITEILRSKGIKLGKGDMEKLVDEIASEIKGEIDA